EGGVLAAGYGHGRDEGRGLLHVCGKRRWDGMAGCRLRAEGANGRLAAQPTPRTWSLSFMPVPSIPMEKVALAVSPSASAIWTVKSSFSSGAGCACVRSNPPISTVVVSLPEMPFTLLIFSVNTW